MCTIATVDGVVQVRSADPHLASPPRPQLQHQHPHLQLEGHKVQAVHQARTIFWKNGGAGGGGGWIHGCVADDTSFRISRDCFLSF